MNQKLEDYLYRLVPLREDEMVRMEERARQSGFPIIGATAGYACYQIARMIGAKRIFEMGSGYGYSTAWFCKAVQENGGGEVHHVVWDETLSAEAQEHLAVLGYQDIVHYHIAEAVEELRRSSGQFDLIFCDIDKRAYPGSLEVIDKKLKPGGALIVDNMIWGGRVFDQKDQSPSTQAIRQLTQMLVDDPSWLFMVYPVRDGLGVAYKVP